MTVTTYEIETNTVRKLKGEGLTHKEIADRLGFSERTSRRRFAAAQIMEAAGVLAGEDNLLTFPDVDSLNIVVEGPYIPEDKGPIERFAPLVRTGDAMVTCDWHIPLHDPILINKMIRVARRKGLTKLIIGGDYWNMETFSSYLPYQPEAGLQQERYDGALIAKTLLETFDEVDFIWGNHDFRLAKKLGYKQSFEECMKWMFSDLTEEELSKFRFSDLDYMHYFPKDPDQQYRICHPRNFSSTPLTVARKLAQKYNMGVITAHSHHCAIGAAPNGVDICIEGGGFFDKNRTEYIQKSTTHHEWVQGFTTFIDGVPNVYSPTFGNI